MSSPEYSPSYDSAESDEAHGPWKWNHFEVRTLVCLIIKGEHKVSKDPMHLTDKLNQALNPGSAGRNADYSRDVPLGEVQAMLKRILSKKSHAVDLCSRDYSGTPVTRAKVNAFMRNLDFDGSKMEWVNGRKMKMHFETKKRLERYMVRKDGGRLSPRPREERDRRRMLLREPRARRLLNGWGIGASFWEDEPKTELRLMNRDPFRATHSSSGPRLMPIGRPPMGIIDSINTPNARDPVAMWAGGFASTAATPQHGAVPPLSTLDMPGLNSTQQLPMLEYGGNGGHEGYGGFGNPTKL
ncbi:hypothetical protein KVR01_004450 [Diaporthe batatas]|uniref:uncharacterized protein n=1 Tax=Diaporthe batatas TaxID=748121 RepID=UPI001D046A81|nr:uncharacterized protein KVR01_004450 [Diaporthe batatas]KAG8165898.1 hypothetical protein KVR01_004450 [Diaporthe batatas]